MNNFNKSIYHDFQVKEKDIQGWHSTDPIFKDLLLKVKPKVIIEVGTWKGASAIHMADIVKQHKQDFNTETIFCVDTWLGATEFITYHKDHKPWDLQLVNGYPSIYYTFLSNVVHCHHDDIIIPIPNTSSNAYRYFEYHNIKADLIYIDGSHEEEDVYTDIMNYYKLLTPGGVIFGDDFNSWPGVKAAVQKANKPFTVQGQHWIMKNDS